MEGPRHKRIVIRRIAENDKLCTAVYRKLLCLLCSLLDDGAHQAHSVHVNARLGRSKIYGGADNLRLLQRLRNGTDQKLICLCHALGHKCAVASKEIHTDLSCHLIQSLCDFHKILRAVAGRPADQSDGRHRNSFVDNRNPEITGNIFPCRNKILRQRIDFLINILLQSRKIRADAVQETDAHRDRADIQILLFNHGIGFFHFADIDHNNLRSVSDSMHRIEDFFLLAFDLNAKLLSSDHGKLFCHIAEGLFQLCKIHNHHHVEIALHDRLGNVQNVDPVLCKKAADACNDSDGVLSDNRDDRSFLHVFRPFLCVTVLYFNQSGGFLPRCNPDRKLIRLVVIIRRIDFQTDGFKGEIRIIVLL